MEDLRIITDMFLTLMLVEALVKPVALRVGRHLLRELDAKVTWIPDWLHHDKDR